MERRDFLKTAAVTGVVSVAALSLPGAETASKTAGSGKCDLVIVNGGTPAEMFDKGIAELGGMSAFVKKGQKVAIKPNIGWAKTPEYAATTNPELIKRIVESCFSAGASEVWVFDHTCNNWKDCYRLSGISEAAKSAGAKVLPGHSKSEYKEVTLPQGKRLKTAQIHKNIIDCDVFINVPVLKNHGGAILTGAMKNLMGIVWDRRYFHGNDLQQCIADSVTYRKPDLNIVDAFNAMKAHGPRGKNLDDVLNLKTLLMSTDIVAVDTAACPLIGLSPEKIGHLKCGEELKLGTMNLDKLNVKRITLA
ncbi:MAG: DUF362 domain-containing protein [Victivallaceae bacterium]